MKKKKTVEPQPCSHTVAHLIPKKDYILKVCRGCGRVVERIKIDTILTKVTPPEPSLEKVDVPDIYEQ